MTKREVAEMMTILQANYPDSFRGLSDSVMATRVKLWHEVFRDKPAEVVRAAAMAYIASDTRGFMPTVGQINDRLSKMRHAGDRTQAEAWALVYQALGKSAWYSAEEFEKLPPDVQRAVGNPEQLKAWALMDSETVQSVVASNFQKSYRIRAERDAEMEKLPPDVRKFISRFAGTLGALDAGLGEEASDNAEG